MAEKTKAQKKTINAKVTIDTEICKGCNLCVSVCPTKCLALDHSWLNQKGYNPAKVLAIKDCIACGFCGIICPDSAIMVERKS